MCTRVRSVEISRSLIQLRKRVNERWVNYKMQAGTDRKVHSIERLVNTLVFEFRTKTNLSCSWYELKTLSILFHHPPVCTPLFCYNIITKGSRVSNGIFRSTTKNLRNFAMLAISFQLTFITENYWFVNLYLNKSNKWNEIWNLINVLLTLLEINV